MSGQPKDGGPAFPRVGEGFGDPRYDAPGMSLRDWFAGQALIGILSAPATASLTGHRMTVEQMAETREALAEACFGAADALLAERAK